MTRLVAVVVILLSAVPIPILGEVVFDAGGRFEDLLGVHVGQRGITFQVAGQGPHCTQKADFHVERFGDDPARLILMRDIGMICRHSRVCGRERDMTTKPRRSASMQPDQCCTSKLMLSGG